MRYLAKNKYIILLNCLFLTIVGCAFLILRGASVQLTGKFHYSYIFLGLYPIAYIAYLIVFKKKFGNPIDKILVPILLIVLYSYLLTTILYHYIDPNLAQYEKFTFTYFDDVGKKWIAFETFLITLLTLYIAFYPLVKSNKSEIFTKILIFTFLLFLWVSIIYSLIFESSFYQSLFGEVKDAKKSVESFFGNKNAFGAYLLIGMISTLVLDYKKPHEYSIILSFIFFIFICFTQSAGSFIVAAVAMAFIVIYGSIRLIKTKHIAHQIFGVLLIASIILFSLMLATSTQVEIPLLSQIMRFMSKGSVEKEFQTLSNRTPIWILYFKNLSSSPINFIFGFGNGLTKISIPLDPEMGAHNTYLQTWVDGGLLYLAFTLLVYVFVFIGLVKLLKAKKISTAFYFGMAMLCIIAHGMVETTEKFQISIPSLASLLFVIIPVLRLTKSQKSQDIVL